MDFYGELDWRGIIHEKNGARSETEGIRADLHSRKVVGYIGFDPTAPSLHVGSLLPLMTLARFQKAGHTPIAILGGATGRVGDPSGKTDERVLIPFDELERNLEGIAAQICRFVDVECEENPGFILDNSQWLADVRLLDFLRDVGRHFAVSQMLKRESIRQRLDQEGGLTFTALSYMLLQAFDFLVLHDEYDCTLQMGGSDQWGNITSGIELIRRVLRKTVHGLVFNLVTASGGKKFGKTEEGTVWLDPTRTTPFDFYQFWYNTTDKDVVKYLKYFTWLSREQIETLENDAQRHPEHRVAQRTLAKEVTRTIHGEDSAIRAERASALLFGDQEAEIRKEDIQELLDNVPNQQIGMERLEENGILLCDLAVESGFLKSKSEARRLIDHRGFYVNGKRILDTEHTLSASDVQDSGLVTLRKGQKQYMIIHVT